MSISVGEDFAAILRALEDIHIEVGKASKSIDVEYSGPTKAADQRINLIHEYSCAVARIIEAFTKGGH